MADALAKKNRSSRASDRQLKLLVDYMSMHSSFAAGRFTGAMGSESQHRQWETLTALLNEAGIYKNTEQWKKTWRDLRRNVRAKAARISAASRATGNKPVEEALSDLESKCLAVIGPEMAVGISTVREICNADPVPPLAVSAPMESVSPIEEPSLGCTDPPQPQSTPRPLASVPHMELLLEDLFPAPKVETPKKKQESGDLERASSLLVEAVRELEVTSEEVVQAFIDRIIEINPVLNCVVDDRFHAALEEAKKIDESIKMGRYTPEELNQKPFLGVPFSSKVSTMVKGLRHTIGLASRRNIIADEDADVVKAMRAAGGIPLAVTNVPELGMWYETWCTAHGQTYNPYDTTRTTGGSSGGEAALVAACGSPIGIGTDIGGSLRMPAFFCGIFGHKPTTGLVPLKGLNRRTGSEINSMVGVGPLCTHAKDLIPILHVLVGEKVKLLKLDTEVEPMKLKYYYMLDDSATPDGLGGDFRLSVVHGKLKVTMLKVASYFKERNAPVTEVWLSKMRYGLRLWRYWMTQEPEKFAKELANRQGEVNVWTELPKKIMGMSDFSLPAMYRLVDDKLPPVDERWARETTSALLNEVVTLLGEDGVLLYPSHPFPAFYRNSSLLRPYNFAYTAALNVLNLPVTQVPLGLNADGLPVGIQVVGAPFKDHLCLAVARELENAFGGWVPPFQST